MHAPLRSRLRLLAAFMLSPWVAHAQSSGSNTSGSVAPAQGVAAAPASRNEAGKIDLVAGTVTVTAPDRSSRAPKQGESIYEGDAVTTGRDGELHLTMLDAGVIAVRPNTQMSITKYLAEGGAEDTSVFSLLKGSFRSITGWIGKNNPTRYSINTPTATIGVRGTDHEPMVIPEGSSDGEPGTYDKVSAGGSFIRGQRGSVDVTPGRAGFFSQRGTGAPRLLDRVPTFFRPGRNEARLTGLHDRIRGTLDARRSERQQFVRQRQQQIQQQRQQPGQQRQQPGQPGQTPAQQQRQQQRQERQEQRQELRQERQGAQQRQGNAAGANNATSNASNGQQRAADTQAEHRQELQQERRAQAQQRVQQAQEHRQANTQAAHNAQAAAQSHAAEERRKRLEEAARQHHR